MNIKHYALSIISLLAANAGAQTVLNITADSSLTHVMRHAREMRRTGQVHPDSTITVNMKAGTYRLYEPVFVRYEDNKIHLKGEPGTVVSGGIEIDGWKRKGKVWVADVPDFNGRPIEFRQLWINGSKADRARDVANFNDMYRVMSLDKVNRRMWVPRKAVEMLVDKNSKTQNSKTQKLKNSCQYSELVIHEMWCVANLRIKSIEIDGDSAAISFHNPESRIQFEHPWPCPMITTDGRNSAFYITNAMELLDQPGEWYHDIRAHKLYYYPRPGEDMSNVKAEVPVLETLLRIEGTQGREVADITFEGITFSHTGWLRPSTHGHVPLQAGMYLTDAYKLRPQISRVDNHKLDNQGWIERADAAIELTHTRNVNFEQCTFTHLGGCGIDYKEGCTGGKVNGCTFTDIAMNGYVGGAFSLPAYETHMHFSPENYPWCTGQVISNSLFQNVGNEDWGCLAIVVGFANHVQITHNEICEVPYSGISVGWGWNRWPTECGHNLVHANKIHHYAKHMYDVAGIYTLGEQYGTVISENAVSDIYAPPYAHDPHHWFYLYTDEGSRGITVRDNWCPEEKFLKNACGPDNVWTNNGPMVSDEIKKRAGRKEK